MNHIISNTAVISPKADIEISNSGLKLYIDDHTVIDAFVKIKFSGFADIRIGRRCYINSGCVLYCGNGITMGDNVIIAANCTFAGINHAYSNHKIPIRDQGFLPSKGGILIENDVWIGAGCVFLDGAVVRSGCVIAANSLIKGECKSNGIYAGAPAQFLRYR
ncbi:MAG: acetyltransferase [Gammaproteobacteria bacterium RIFCSPHIGHO2_12_FULL_38_14]|nr:MAG: acetyltransferase [Gammaproteobacteria bacterium RIFCSPHIGHO2_12_FULL_38_14]